MSEKEATTRRSGKAPKSAEVMLRELVESYDAVLDSIRQGVTTNTTVPFVRAHRKFEALMRKTKEVIDTVPAPVMTGPGHWLGCSLDPSHEGDCLVPRATRGARVRRR